MKTTAIGVVAACSASSSVAAVKDSSSIPTTIVSQSGGVYKEHHNRKQHSTQNVINSIRGGSSAPASSTTSSTVEEHNEIDAEDIAKENAEKKRRKKKKYKKKQQTNNKKSNASSSQQSTKKKTSSTEKEDSKDQSSTSESSTKTNNNNNSSKSSPLSPEAQSILNQTCHYAILGITKSATQSQIQKAYRKRCIITHPDKVSGDRSAFDKVSVAYDILSCEKKRAVYDKFGKRGLDQGLDVHSDGVRGFGMGMGNGQFGTDVFRDFFSGTGIDPFNFGRRQQQQQQQSTRRNRDLRYQLEVTLEELYNGTTKHVLIQQPNGSSYYQHHRKEVEVTLPKGMSNGQSVRLSGVVDSVKDAPPADVIFIIRERRHSIFTRRGNDLAIEVSITYSESIVGYKRSLKCLNGKEIVICNPVKTEVVKVDEVVDAPSLPKLQVEEDTEEVVSTLVKDDGSVENDNSTNCTVTSNNITTTASTADATIEQVEIPSSPEQITKTTTTSYKLPPSIIQNGDVHVLKGYGMPIKGYQGHDSDEYGNLYIQYRVESPLSSSATTKSSNLSPQERVDLARLLNKLEGNTDDIAKDVAVSSDETITGEDDHQEKVHHLKISSASDFGRATDSSVNNHGDDEHLRHDEDDVNMPHGFRSSEDVSDFVHRAFAGRTGPFGGTSFGFSTFTSSGGGGYGYNGHGEEEDHKVECNQM